MRALWETIEGLVIVLGGFLLTALPVLVLWLLVDEGEAVWGLLVLGCLLVWVFGGVLTGLWRRPRGS
jgi:hypothetical protein